MKSERESSLRRKINRLIGWVGLPKGLVKKRPYYRPRPVDLPKETHTNRKASTVGKTI